MEKKIVRQVGSFQELNQDARSTIHKKHKIYFPYVAWHTSVP